MVFCYSSLKQMKTLTMTVIQCHQAVQQCLQCLQVKSEAQVNPYFPQSYFINIMFNYLKIHVHNFKYSSKAAFLNFGTWNQIVVGC